jgi:Helix-turn-helix domain
VRPAAQVAGKQRRGQGDKNKFSRKRTHGQQPTTCPGQVVGRFSFFRLNEGGPMNEQEILTLAEAGKLLKFSESQMREICRSRSRMKQAHPIPVMKIGKSLRFRRGSLLEWLSQIETKTVQ